MRRRTGRGQVPDHAEDRPGAGAALRLAGAMGIDVSRLAGALGNRIRQLLVAQRIADPVVSDPAGTPSL